MSLLKHSNALARSLRLNPAGWLGGPACRIGGPDSPVWTRVITGPNHTLVRLSKNFRYDIADCPSSLPLKIFVRPVGKASLVFRPHTYFPDRHATMHVVDPSQDGPRLIADKVRRLPRGLVSVVSCEFDRSNTWPSYLALTGHPHVQLLYGESVPLANGWIEDLLKELRIGLNGSLMEELKN